MSTDNFANGRYRPPFIRGQHVRHKDGGPSTRVEHIEGVQPYYGGAAKHPEWHVLLARPIHGSRCWLAKELVRADLPLMDRRAG